MNPCQQDALRHIGQTLANASRIALASHVRPDGDAVGSLIALTDTLRQLGKEAVAWSQDEIPGRYRFLDPEGVIEPPRGDFEPDWFVALDTANRDRLGQRVWQALPAEVQVIVLDHHVSNQNYGRLNYVDEQSPAVGQIVYQLIRLMQWPLSKVARDGLWAAIVTDTGSFQFPSTTAQTLETGAELLRAGVDIQSMTHHVYQSYPIRRLHLLRELLESLELRDGGAIAFWQLTQAAIHRLKLEAGDSDGLIDHLRSISGVVLAVAFEEGADGRVRISARSTDAHRVNANELCREFGGGGHSLAAGVRMPGSLDDVTQRFLTAASTRLNHGYS